MDIKTYINEIKAQVTRIQGEKEELVEVIRSTGVQVPDGAKMSEMVPLVGTIPEVTIETLPDEVVDTSDATATADKMLKDETAYVNGEKITGTIEIKTSNDLTTSGATVTVPAGYYNANASKSVATATQATPAITVNASGLITATATQTSGYVTAGSKSATKQLAFQAAKTITPTTTNQTAVSSGYYTGGAITVKGDSNLVASNIKSGVSIFGVNGTYAGSGGDTSMEDGIVTGEATSYMNDRVTTIGSYAFCSRTSLTTVSFPNAISIGHHAFFQCTSLTTVNFPNAISIGDYALANCDSLTSVSFPSVTNIGIYAFKDCYSLTTVSFPRATSIRIYTFMNCSRLTSANFPSVISISAYAFSCCYNLSTASFPKVTAISNGAFDYCSKLSQIYLKNSSICSLAASGAFWGTLIGSDKGSIFVPSSLVASYKKATNWAFFSNRIFAAP